MYEAMGHNAETQHLGSSTGSGESTQEIVKEMHLTGKQMNEMSVHGQVAEEA